MCEYCKEVSKELAVVSEQSDNGIHLNLQGAYLQIFDEDYPGFVDNIPINYCPMCGRKLHDD